ncbi:MAG: serine/threonine-protein kinase [Gemmatimonadales bacterium]
MAEPTRRPDDQDPPAEQPVAGQVIAGRYQVESRLGRGSFGETLLAHDVEAERPVAIKVLSRPTDLKAYQLFEREARVLRSLRHRGVPEVFAQLRAEWQGVESTVLVMEYIDGRSLTSLIEDGPRPEQELLLHLFVELLGVLDYLHGRVPPVLHRDIKPSNVIVRDDGSPALVDFGAVRSVFRGAGEDGSTIVGTYGYMPYEQYMGQASPASDLFALAATFLHLTTGRPPRDFMSGEGRLEVPAALPCGEPLQSVLTKLLASNPAERFQSAREARAALFGAAAPASRALAGPSAGRTVSVAATRLVEGLYPAPRQVTGGLKEVENTLVGDGWQLLDSSRPPYESRAMRAVGKVLMTLVGIGTFGILPIVYWTISFQRRKRLRPFMTDGLPATATIMEMDQVTVGGAVRYTRVRYEFSAGRRDPSGRGIGCCPGSPSGGSSATSCPCSTWPIAIMTALWYRWDEVPMTTVREAFESMEWGPAPSPRRRSSNGSTPHWPPVRALHRRRGGGAGGG